MLETLRGLGCTDFGLMDHNCLVGCRRILRSNLMSTHSIEAQTGSKEVQRTQSFSGTESFQGTTCQQLARNRQKRGSLRFYSLRLHISSQYRLVRHRSRGYKGQTLAMRMVGELQFLKNSQWLDDFLMGSCWFLRGRFGMQGWSSNSASGQNFSIAFSRWSSSFTYNNTIWW